MDGVPGTKVKDRMAQLETRKAELERLLENARDEPLRLHPGMAKVYRDEIAALREALAGEGRHGEAAKLLRSAIDRIELVPVEVAGKKTLAANLHGRLAGILAMATESAGELPEDSAPAEWRAMVAGAGFEPATFRL